MKTQTRASLDITVAKAVAGEDLHTGDYIALLYTTTEMPSCFWRDCDFPLSPHEMVRLKHLPADAGQPLKVIGICLPFVYVQQPCHELKTIDLRSNEVVRLDRNCAKTVWKMLQTRQSSATNSLI